MTPGQMLVSFLVAVWLLGAVSGILVGVLATRSFYTRQRSRKPLVGLSTDQLAEIVRIRRRFERLREVSRGGNGRPTPKRGVATPHIKPAGPRRQ